MTLLDLPLPLFQASLIGEEDTPISPMAETLEGLLPLSITELSQQLKRHMEEGFSNVTVQGEISGCKKHTSGHTYFSLKDHQCVLDAICWRGTKISLSLCDGHEVICTGRITTYGGRSKYQLIVEGVQPVGQGLLLQKIENLRVKLLAEGLFDAQAKKPLPPFPQRIGLITSPTGAVIHDMMAQFSQRLPCELMLYPVAVQGAQAVREILQALEFFKAQSPPPDVLILARGGGSVEDLWAFHEEALVRAVAASPLPIVSAIGHESDTTLVDYAADYRAATPTAAAERVLPLRRDLLETLDQGMMQLRRCLHHALSLGQGRWEAQNHRFKALNIIRPLEQRLDEGYEGLEVGLHRWILQRQHRWDMAALALDKCPLGEHLQARHERLDRLWERLKGLVREKFQKLEALTGSYKRLLAQLSHERTLERGFVLVLEEGGRVCASKKMALEHPRLSLRFSDGDLPVEVGQYIKKEDGKDLD